MKYQEYRLQSNRKISTDVKRHLGETEAHECELGEIKWAVSTQEVGNPFGGETKGEEREAVEVWYYIWTREKLPQIMDWRTKNTERTSFCFANSLQS